MAKQIPGRLFLFTGSIGDYVGSTWKGMYVVRRKPGPRKGPPSVKQLAQQKKFSFLMKFLKPLDGLLKITYRKYATKMTPFNKAFSENMKTAVTGEYPSLSIQYERVVLSRGELPLVQSPVVSASLTGKLAFSWTDNSGQYRALTTDSVFIAVYCEALGEWICNMNAALRKSLVCMLDVSAFSGRTVQVYIGMMAEDQTSVSYSHYLGASVILDGRDQIPLHKNFIIL